VKQCSKFVECFSNWLTIHKVIIKVQHSCVIMFHMVVQPGFKKWHERLYLFYFQQRKNFQNRLTVKVILKSWTARFFQDTV